MSDPYVGEIRMFAGNFAPADWLLCQGQLVAISDYDTLYSLIGTTYGGDGQNTFGLPNLASRVPLHVGALGGSYQLGGLGGTEQVTLSTQQLPMHSHGLGTAGSAGTTNVPAGNTVLSDMGPSGTSAPPAYGAYNPASTVTLNGSSIMPAGGSQPHDNIQPSLAINFIISMYGAYPPRS